MKHARLTCIWIFCATALIGCAKPASESNTEQAVAVAPEDIETLARCLKNDGWVLYSSFTCPACRLQERLFGDAFGHIPLVECNPNAENAQTEECIKKRIRKTPTWIQEQEGTELGRVEGYQRLDALDSMSSCDAFL